MAVVKVHSHAEGGDITIFQPSIRRERQTVADRLYACTAEQGRQQLRECPGLSPARQAQAQAQAQAQMDAQARQRAQEQARQQAQEAWARQQAQAAPSVFPEQYREMPRMQYRAPGSAPEVVAIVRWRRPPRAASPSSSPAPGVSARRSMIA